MFLLLSYLISLAVSEVSMDGTDLKITDPEAQNIQMATVAQHTTATTCTISSTKSVGVGQQAFSALTSLKTVTITAPEIVISNQGFQQSGISGLLSLKATGSVTIGKTAFISATVGDIYIEAGGDINLYEQAFQEITKAANLTLHSGRNITIGKTCFITSPIESINFIAQENITLIQQAFQQCPVITNLYMESINGGITIGLDCFIAASINNVTLLANLEVNIEQQAMQQVTNFETLYVETNGNFISGLTAFIASTIQTFEIHSGGNVSFLQQSFQETKKLANFSVYANDTIDFGHSSFIQSTVNSMYLSSNGPIYFGQQAFQECKQLTSVVIDSPANVTFGNSCFISSQIEKLNISYINRTSSSSALILADETSTITFESQSCANCNQLKTVDIDSQGNVDVGASSFKGSTALNNVNIHSTGKTTVGDNAFSGCTSLDRDNAKINGENMPDNAFGGGGSSGKKKGGSSSNKDDDDKEESSAKTLGNFDINSVYLGTSPNIVVDLNIFVTLMRKARLAFGHVVPSPDFIHSAIWVGKDKDVNDKSVGAIFVYGKYWNKYNMNTYLEKNGAKAIVMTLGEFKQRYPQINPMKLNANKNMKLFDFINEVKASGHWSVNDYNWPTNNCQHFTAKLIDILHATRDAPANSDWADLPKPVMNSLKANEKEN